MFIFATMICVSILPLIYFIIFKYYPAMRQKDVFYRRIIKNINGFGSVKFIYSDGLFYLFKTSVYGLFISLIISGYIGLSERKIIDVVCIFFAIIIYIYSYCESIDIAFGSFIIADEYVYISRLSTLFSIKKYDRKMITDVFGRVVWLGTFIEIHFHDKFIVRLHGVKKKGLNDWIMK